ncbi:helix-turn-helix domain-containing protein [Phormidesmis priestleyi]
MHNMDLLNRQIQVVYGRVLGLHQQAPESKTATSEVLPIALRELGLASEELQVAVEELSRQNEVLVLAQYQAQSARLRYQSVFEFAPDALLITSLSGTVQEVNRAAAALFDRHARYLTGKPLVSLVTFDDRTTFRNLITRLNQRDGSTTPQNRAQILVRFQRQHQEWFEAGLTVDIIFDEQEEPLLLRWQVQDLTSCKQAVAALIHTSPSRACDRYRKGEVIPIEAQTLWLVAKGVVKLTTLSERGEEILVGLAAEEQVFGASLTQLPVYQAIALSDVELVAIPVSEMTQSTEFAQTLLPRIVDRLQQAERFVTMHGHLRAQDRLSQLLQLLRVEIGEAPLAVTAEQIDDGSGIRSETRLKAKLTHQDFASACCTTRVTITRLLGQLQQQGKIRFDAQNHLIIKDNIV